MPWLYFPTAGVWLIWHNRPLIAIDWYDPNYIVDTTMTISRQEATASAVGAPDETIRRIDRIFQDCSAGLSPDQKAALARALLDSQSNHESTAESLG